MAPEFLELIETYRAGEISVRNIFGGEGRRIVPRSGPEYERKLAEAVKFIADVTSGRRPVRQLQEALTTSDFPYLFGDTLDRQMLASYRAPMGPIYEWRDYCQVKPVPDFRTVKRFLMTGATARMQKVKQKGEYQEDSREETKYEYAVSKYGRKLDLAWETFINDDLGAFSDLPQVFATAARNTEFYEFSNLWVNNTTFFSAGNGNKGTAALSVVALGSAIEAMRSQTSDGAPILIEPKYLVVPPALEITARNILNSIALVVGGGAGASPDYYPTYNAVAQLGLVLKVNPWIPLIDTTNGNTSWYLFAEPAQSPAVEMGFLRGYEDPQVFMKSPDAVRVGGGEVSPFDGSFDNDDLWYKLRHVLGGAVLDPKNAYWSDGTAQPGP